MSGRPSRLTVGTQPAGHITGQGDEHERVVKQHRRVETGTDVADREGDVELARDEAAVRLVLVVGLEDSDVDARVLGTQAPDDRGQQGGGHALKRAHADAADVAGEETLDLAADDVDPTDQLAAVGQHEPAERGERRRSGATGAVEKRCPDHPLEGGDLLADRRLRIAETARRAGERAFGGDGVEGHQVAQFEVVEGRYVISLADH